VKEKNNEKNNPRYTNEQQLFLQTKNRKFRSYGKLSISRAEKGYCNETTESIPSTRNQIHQALNILKNTEAKQRMAWTSEGIKEVWFCMYCRKYLIHNSKKCMNYGDNQIQTGECTWMQRHSQTRTTVSWKNKKNSRDGD
jgi:hypothetical protein